MFSEGRSTDVVVADSNLSLLQDLLPTPLAPGSYFNRSGLVGALGSVAGADSRHMLQTLMSRRYTSIADVDVLQRILVLCGPEAKHINTHFARDFSPEDLKTFNIVLLGSKRSNPWVRFFEDDLNFHFETDGVSGYGVVVNTHPSPGEQARYNTTIRNATFESYGLVAFLPNLSRTGNVLLLEGAGMHATEAAGEFVTQENLFAPLLRNLSQSFVSDRGTLPYFEALFKTRVLDAAMQPPQLVSVRIHSRPTTGS